MTSFESRTKPIFKHPSVAHSPNHELGIRGRVLPKVETLVEQRPLLGEDILLEVEISRTEGSLGIDVDANISPNRDCGVLLFTIALLLSISLDLELKSETGCLGFDFGFASDYCSLA